MRETEFSCAFGGYETCRYKHNCTLWLSNPAPKYISQRNSHIEPESDTFTSMLSLEWDRSGPWKKKKKVNDHEIEHSY